MFQSKSSREAARKVLRLQKLQQDLAPVGELPEPAKRELIEKDPVVRALEAELFALLDEFEGR